MAPNESDGNDGVVCNQAEMERALLQGEASVQLDKVALDERQLEALRGRDQRLGRELDAFRADEGARIAATKARMEDTEAHLNRYTLPLSLSLSLPSYTASYHRFAGFYLFLPGFTELYWIIPSFAGFYRVLLGFIEFYWILIGFTYFYWVLLSYNGFYQVLLGFT